MPKLMQIILLSVSLTLYACASPVFSKIKITIPNDFPMVNTEVRDKIPLRAGLFLNPFIRNLSYNGATASTVQKTSFFMGNALCSGSERMLRNIFKDVVIIDQMGSNLSERNIDMIVTPEIIELSQQIRKTDKNKQSSMDYQPFVLQLIIKWTIMSLDGKNIYFNTITGEDTPKRSFAFTVSGIEEMERENMFRLMNDQFLKAQDDLYSNAWWKNQWWKDSKN